jgi:hypothetical protein
MADRILWCRGSTPNWSSARATQALVKCRVASTSKRSMPIGRRISS